MDGGDVTPGGTGTPAVTTLVNQTFAAPTNFTFTPSAVGRLITTTITGNVTGSRPAVQVLDNNGNVVANEFFPTTNATTVTFTTSAAAPHTVFFFEFGVPSTTYTATVTEQ
jgi:hypothetical protein